MLSREDGLADSYATYLNSLRRGLVPPNLRRALISGRGVGVPKPISGVRPLVVGDSHLRFVGRIDTTRSKPKMRTRFLRHPRVSQYGCGCAQGSEIMFRHVHDLLATNPDLLGVTIDLKNAFNEYDRSSESIANMWDLVDTEFPELAAHVRMLYGVPGEILLREANLDDPAVVLNDTGSRQGDPFSSLLFALTQHPILEQVADEFPTIEIVAFVDDAWFLGEASAVAQAQKRYAYLYAEKLCGSLNETKSAAFSFGLTHAQAIDSGLSPDIPWATGKTPGGTTIKGGLRLMGAPLGPIEYQRAYLAATIQHATVSLRRVARMHHTQDRFTLLRLSFSKKFGHLQRLVDTHSDPIMLSHMEHWEDAIMASTADLVCDRGTMSEVARRIAALPPGLGGLGIESASARATPAFYASFKTSTTALVLLHPRLKPLYQPQSNLHAVDQANQALARLTQVPKMRELMQRVESTPTPSRRYQGKLTSLIMAETHRLLLGELDDRSAGLLHSSSLNPHLFCAIPKSDPGLRLANKVFSCALARRLCIPQHMTFNPSSIECNLPCSACYEHHCNRHLDQALFCVKRARLREWHNPITEVLYRLLRAHGFTVHKDPGHDLTSQTKTDGIVEFGPIRVFIDTRTVVAIQPKSYAAEAVYPGTSLDNCEAEKIQKHAGYLRANCPKDEFVPFTMDEQGAMGEAAQFFLDRVFLTSDCPVASKTYWLRILAAENARCLYTMLHAPFVAGISTQRRIPCYDTEGGTPTRTTPHPDHESDPAADMATPPVPHTAPAPAPSPAPLGIPPTTPPPPAPPLRPPEVLRGTPARTPRPWSGHAMQNPTPSSPSSSPRPSSTPLPTPNIPFSTSPSPSPSPSRASQLPVPSPMPAHPAEQHALATNHVSPGTIETLNSWLIPTAQNWNELTRLLVGPKPNTIVLSPSRCFFAVTPSTMKVLLQSAQSTIALGINSHITHFTLDPSDIPTARDQNELARLLAASSAYSVVSYDGYFAVKPAILATLLSCFRASLPNTGPSSNPSSNSGPKNHDDDVDDDDEEASQTGSLSRTC